jgi:hypothetical protein
MYSEKMQISRKYYMQQQLLQFPGTESTNAEEVLSLLELLGSSITIKQNQYKIKCVTDSIISSLILSLAKCMGLPLSEIDA